MCQIRQIGKKNITYGVCGARRQRRYCGGGGGSKWGLNQAQVQNTGDRDDRGAEVGADGGGDMEAVAEVVDRHGPGDGVAIGPAVTVLGRKLVALAYMGGG